jgi:hypothetical protein
MNMKKRIFLTGIALFMALFMVFISGCPMEEDDDPSTIIEEELKPFENLTGTKWLWGVSLLEFDDEHAIFRGNQNYLYTYTVDLEAGTGRIEGLADFTLSANRRTLELVDYRNNGLGYNAVFTRKNPETLTIPTDTVIGTEWNLTDDDGTRFLHVQWIIFFDNKYSLNQSGGGVFEDRYTYNKDAQTGWIYYINNFEIRNNGQTLYIPKYKEYTHDMICTRVE